MKRKWLSRKFITALAAQLAAMAVLFWPAHEQAIVEATRNVAALAVIALSAMGYLAAEASVDRADLGSANTPEASES